MSLDVLWNGIPDCDALSWLLPWPSPIRIFGWSGEVSERDLIGQSTNSRFAAAAPILLIVTAPLRASESTSPFAINGWQLHEFDIRQLEEAVREAPEGLPKT